MLMSELIEILNTGFQGVTVAGHPDSVDTLIVDVIYTRNRGGVVFNINTAELDSRITEEETHRLASHAEGTEPSVKCFIQLAAKYDACSDVVRWRN